MTEERQASAPPGEILGGKYRLVRLIGEGAMGRVYEAQHAFVGRRFAVKVLQAELVREPVLVERFQREAQAAGALESENIASVIDFGHTADGLPYIVMELLIGEDLSSLLGREGPLPIARVVSLGVQTCRGLKAAHEAGIVHRDLKPGNLFVSQRSDGSDLIKILDFGIAKLDRAEASLMHLTRTGSMMGTPLYMSPEHARGEKQLDHRADIYATAVILYEALSGQMPHFGDSYNAVLHSILTQPAPALTSLRPGIPVGLADAIHWALSPNRDDRPQSAMEFAGAISGYAAEATSPPSARTATAIMPVASTMLLSTPVEAKARPAVAATSRSASRRRWRLGLGICAALGLALVLVGARATRPKRDGPPQALAPALPVAPHEDLGSLPPPQPDEPDREPHRAVSPTTAVVPAPEPTNTDVPATAEGAAKAPHHRSTHLSRKRRLARPNLDDANPYQ